MKHLADLEEVFKSFRKANMTLKLKKCEFAKGQIDFVGHKVGGGLHRPLFNKVQAINDITEPVTKKAVKSFLGMMNFFRKFIKNFSHIAFCLTELTKKAAPNKVKFTPEQSDAFTLLKKLLSECASLHSPNYTKDFIIRSDASDIAIGACLLQKDENGEEKPIAFLSSKLTPSQRNWSTIVKEAYGIIFSLNRWDHIIYNSHIWVLTDNNPLHYIASAIATAPMLIRWSISLTRWDITVVHIKGIANEAADFLSRY